MGARARVEGKREKVEERRRSYEIRLLNTKYAVGLLAYELTKYIDFEMRAVKDRLYQTGHLASIVLFG